MTNDSLHLNLLKQMIRIRMVEEEIARQYHDQEMRCPVHLSVGQEAPSAAFSLAVQNDDFAVSTHRGHAHFLAKGGSLDEMIAEIYGKATGCSKGRGGSMHLADKRIGFMGTSAIVGNSIPIGVGLGLSLQINKRKQASCVFLGDGATEEGVFYESVNFSAIRQLPVVFLCENNQYSVYSKLNVRQPLGRNISDMVRGLGITSTEVDGNDVAACYEAINSSLIAARNGEGPQFVEMHTFRHLEHCGPNEDDHLGYRELGELASWLTKDPIQLFEQFLKENGVATSEFVESCRAEITAEINTAFANAKNAPFPDLESCLSDVYA